MNAVPILVLFIAVAWELMSMYGDKPSKWAARTWHMVSIFIKYILILWVVASLCINELPVNARTLDVVTVLGMAFPFFR